jgi:hypothetical protein
MGAKPGTIMSLHTWGQNLSLHPHIHALVTAGGLNNKGEVKYCRENYIFPAKAAMKYFRFIFLKQVKENFHSEPQIKSIVDNSYKINWNVFIKEKYNGGRGVLLYLSRYIRGLPIKDSRIKQYDGNSVTFIYKDYRDGKRKLMKLSIKDFLQKLLLNITPKNLRTYRESGLYFADKIEEFKEIINNKLIPRQSVIQSKMKEMYSDFLTSPIHKHEICQKCNKVFDTLIIIPVKEYKIRGSPRKAA